ncbi:SagG family ABC transporter permease subunit [Clostridium gasigenes]|uniref:SagG family ABC transporter permease subunit n=1 Tax=Clostridium gasigenes TaxID=94869 RepID=UPI0014383F81|nr:SagG family ABC transporter permease subunit [Clostridium gasigenes]NKF07130.1 ABC transporter permease [Clostridium gasigenes]QSW18113.1 SagG family ABC transporter permease subunit [Clostridium gasigenes]
MILNIIKKEILQNLRDKKAMFWMIFFPIIMIFILGNALSSVIGERSTAVPKTKIVYTIEKETDDTKKLENFFNDSKEELNMDFIKNDDKESVLNDIKRGKFDCYLDIENAENIIVYSNDIKTFNAALVTNLLEIYGEKNNALSSIANENPQGLQFVEVDSKPDFIKIRSLDKLEKPTALDYYSVTMLTMIILYATLTGAMTILGERVRRTMPRIACSPINRGTLFFGKLIGAFVIVTIQVGILFLFTKYVFRANWGSDLLPIIGILLTQILMAISLGMGLSRLFNNPNLISVFSNLIIILLNFLGGAYIPLEIFGPNNILISISNISPLKWTNESIFKIIYGQDYSLVAMAIFVNLAVALVFMVLPLVFRRRGEV